MGWKSQSPAQPLGAGILTISLGEPKPDTIKVNYSLNIIKTQ
jgi:hypothetical protein